MSQKSKKPWTVIFLKILSEVLMKTSFEKGLCSKQYWIVELVRGMPQLEDQNVH